MYEQKYLKYKQKYLELKNQIGGNFVVGESIIDYLNNKVGNIVHINGSIVSIIPNNGVKYDTNMANIRKMFKDGDQVAQLDGTNPGIVTVIDKNISIGPLVHVKVSNGDLHDAFAWELKLSTEQTNSCTIM